MSTELTYGIWIALFSIVMLGIGVYASRKIKNTTDFMVAGRGLPFWLATPVLFATWLGGGMILGGSGAAFDYGFWSADIDGAVWGAIPDPYGAGLCLILAGLFYMPILRRMGGLTLSDFFNSRFSNTTAMIVSIFIIISFIFWTAVQVIAFGKIFESMIGVDYFVGILISLVVMVTFTVLGGLWAVSYTDFWQTFIIVAGVVILLPFSINAAGGWDNVVASAPAEYFNFFPTEFRLSAYLPWIGAWMIIGLGSIATPDLAQRAMASKDAKTAKWSAVTAGLLYWVIGTIPVILGIIGFAVISNGMLPADAIAGDPELIIPAMVKAYMPTTIGVIFTLGMIAGIMSAADAALLSVSSIFAKNIYKDYLKPESSDRTVLKVTRISIVVVTIIALFIGVVYPNVFLLMLFSFDIILASLFVPLTLGIWWKKANTTGALAGMISGALFRIVAPIIVEWGYFLEDPFITITYPSTWYYYTVFAPVVSLVVMVVVSLATQKSSPPKPLILAPEGN